MHILYMHQHFASRQGFTGNRSYEFSRQLTKLGHQVTMICSGIDNEPRLCVPPGKQFIEVDVDGIHCVPIAAANANPLKITGHSGYRRMAGFLHFARLAKRVARQLPKPDVIYCSHTPLTIGLAGIDVANFFRVPFVFEVRDLWPQALINLRVLRNRAVIWWMRRMERKIYSAADHIVALSPVIRDGVLAAGVAPEKVTLIPNASDTDLFRPDVDGSSQRQRLGIGDRFAAIYFGGMGHANGLEYAIEAAHLLQQRGNERVVMVLLGDGGKRSEHERQVKEYGLRNVVFLDAVPKQEVAPLVAACDACLIIYRGASEQGFSPNKLFDSLAAGKPVLVNVPGWLTEVVEQAECGVGVDPHHPQELTDALEALAGAPLQVSQMGVNARRLAETDFSREKLTGQLVAVLENAVDQRRKGDRRVTAVDITPPGGMAS